MCDSIVPMPGVTNASSQEAKARGYYIAWKAKCAFSRKKAAALIEYAAWDARYGYPDAPPIGLSDLTQAGGNPQGADVGQPLHAPGTHMGNDMDVAYLQADGSNNPQIIC